MSEVIHPLPNTPLWRGAELMYRDNFTFTFIMYNVMAGKVWGDSF
jgi:hypothetical protein